MPAVSKKQQQFFGIVNAVQKGKKSKKDVSKNLAKVADTMSPKDVHKFAATKTKNLPVRVKKEAITETEEQKIRNLIRNELISIAESVTPYRGTPIGYKTIELHFKPEITALMKKIKKLYGINTLAAAGYLAELFDHVRPNDYN